jgi:hypothetical protein
MKKGRGARPAAARGNGGFVRFVRRVRPDRNPLRRTTDRLETFLLAGSIVAAAVAAPFAVPAAAAASHAAALSAQTAERATRHEITAVLQDRAPDVGDGYSPDSQVLVRATWRAPDGTLHSGQVMAPEGTADGSPVPIWTDRAGHLTGPPLATSQIAGQADLAGVAAAGGLTVLVLCETLIIRRVFDRRRMTAWDADWAVTAPVWNRQRW